MSMSKQDLVAHLADSTGFTRKDTAGMVDTLAQTISDQLAVGNEFTLPGVGKFSIKQRAGRTGRNPKTGESVPIPPSVAVKFSATKALKDAVNA